MPEPPEALDTLPAVRRAMARAVARMEAGTLDADAGAKLIHGLGCVTRLLESEAAAEEKREAAERVRRALPALDRLWTE